MNIQDLVKLQRTYFEQGKTKSLAFRLHALKKLQFQVANYQEKIEKALYQDLGKHRFEAQMSEIKLVQEELKYVIKKLPSWARTTNVPTPLAHFPAKSFIQKEPYGLVLIMAPWNYPFMLNIEPLIGALAAGNCVIIKPSEYAPATGLVIQKMLSEIFMPEYVGIVQGGKQENTELLQQKFDYIFFTGSVNVGKIVMKAAAENLTPVTLELGGKSPCIVEESANIKLAAKRIAFGKFLNAGQTCIAPDYLLVQESVKAQLLQEIEKVTIEFFGKNPLTNPELPKIITEKHFNRLKNLLKGENIVMGGNDDGESRIAPTLVDNATPECALMQEEIFGPILPVLTFKKIEQAINFVNKREKPLALYLFTNNKTTQEEVLQACSFGGGCINDTIVHIANSRMPFGGVGQSGMGRYHGKESFNTFTHQKSILKKANWLDLNVRYHPYTKSKEKILSIVMK